MAGLKRVRDALKFERRCARTPYFSFCEHEKNRPDDEFEDDGALHIVRHGVRAIFNLDQDQPASEQNRRTRLIMETLGMKRKICDRVLVEETANDDED